MGEGVEVGVFKPQGNFPWEDNLFVKQHPRISQDARSDSGLNRSAGIRGSLRNKSGGD